MVIPYFQTKSLRVVKMNKDMALDFVAGGVSAAVSKTVVAPLERVKLLLQIQVGKGFSGACVPILECF